MEWIRSSGVALLLVAGLVHAIPALYTALSNLFGGVPVLQVIIGIASVVVALVLLFGDREEVTTQDS
ncbi:MAG: hypothetical protein PHV61_00720 [Limnochordia bacterium]|jgi:FtsH-binding integral membrane protein|nr:hypothetical protein [Limnochordia bacterium]MDD2628684.1 hypothetical protein [Limnochordia bacterium]MDD4518357.1 hypothetical protein [Limnochordia bacterium]